MPELYACYDTYAKSPPTRGAWIEIINLWMRGVDSKSPPTRGAWIEIYNEKDAFKKLKVAPHTGGVD